MVEEDKVKSTEDAGEKLDSTNGDKYDVLDKTVCALRVGNGLEIVCHIILQHFESGTRIALTATRFIPDTPSFCTNHVMPVEVVVVGDEVLVKDGEITAVIAKKHKE